MKKMITTIWILFFVFCIGIYLYRLDKNKHETLSSGNENGQVKVQEEEEHAVLSQEGLNAGDYRAVVDAAQLKSMNEWCEVYEPHTETACMYQILSAQKSRILREDFKEGVIHFESDFPSIAEYYHKFMSEEGNFERDLYYLYVEVEVCNTGKEKEIFVLNGFPYLQIDENRTATLISLYCIEDVCFNHTALYILVEDGPNTIDEMLTAIMPFKENARCRYTICYIITEQMAEDNNLYVYKTEGSTGRDVLNNKERKYVKLDIQSEEENE